MLHSGYREFGASLAGKLRRPPSVNVALSLVALIVLSVSSLCSQNAADISRHRVQFVTVERDVKLKTLD